VITDREPFCLTDNDYEIVETKDAVQNAFDNVGYKTIGKKVEISYHKAFKMVSERVMQMLGEKIDEKKTFEPPKEPVNKGKTPAFADVNPIWLPG